MNRKILFFFFLLLLANAIIFANKDKFAYKKQISYAALYPTITDIAVNEVVKLNDSMLSINLENSFGKPVKWYAAINHIMVDSLTGVCPQIKLVKGLNTYTVYSPRYKDSLFARIEYIPAYNTKERNNPVFVGLYKTNFGHTTLDEIGSDKDIFDNMGAAQQNELKAILADSVGITNNMGAALKVEKICIYLHEKIYKSAGTPNENTIKLNAFDQYKAAVAGAKIWCGMYARIFNVFVASAGVKCRSVEIFSKYKNVRGSNHVCNEYFLPEQKQWVAADIMYNNIRYISAAGIWLNLVQMKNLDATDSSVNIIAAVADTTLQIPFTKRDIAFYDLYGKEKGLLYIYRTTAQAFSGSLFKRAKNYIFPNYWFQLYSDSSIVDNRNFYIKSLLMCLLLLFSTVMLFVFFIKNIIKKK